MNRYKRACKCGVEKERLVEKWKALSLSLAPTVFQFDVLLEGGKAGFETQKVEFRKQRN